MHRLGYVTNLPIKILILRKEIKNIPVGILENHHKKLEIFQLYHTENSCDHERLKKIIDHILW